MFHLRRPRRILLVLSLAALLVGQASVPVIAEDKPPDASASAWPPHQPPTPEAFKPLKYRSIGPAAGGRVSRACGVPGDPLVYYMATASGGVWKTTDAGLTWKPIFDDQPTSSIGSIAVAPSDANVVYVGGGEANIRGNVAAGNGIYKSTDAGKTWKHVWKQEGQIGTMIVHPKNPDIAFAAVLGHAFGPNPERGVYRTKDGGKTWERVLAKDPDTGASDVCFDPSNPNILFAGMWPARRKPWEMTSGGPGGGLYVSRDGGDTWKQLGPPERGTRSSERGAEDPQLRAPSSELRAGEGLPPGPYGKINLAVAPSDPRRVYAMIEAEKGGLYRSDDGGDKWEYVNGNRYLRIRPWYFNVITVDPQNPDVIYALNLRLFKSIDGGKTFQQVKGTHHVDHHDLWIDPQNPKRMIDSNDGGVDISTNGGATWHAPMLPISQFYHINCDNRVPYHVSGTMQDLGTASGPSNSLSKDGIRLADWHGVGGGETGYTMPDPADPNVVYAGEYGGYLSRYDHRTRQARNVAIYPVNPSGHGAEDWKYRFQWTAPVLISPHDPKTVYHAGNVLFRTTDAGHTWKPISPDLTRNDKAKQKWSGGPITGDNTTAEYYCTIFAIAESPKEKGVLWAGSDDGLVHVSRDGGQKWDNVTKNIPNLPEWGTVVCIEASRFDAGAAYVVVDAHRLDNMRPYLWKTTDYGQTWETLTAKLPQDIYLHIVREDPKKKDHLYVGTERGVIFSPNDGATWNGLRLNLPTIAVHDLVVKDNDLVVGTNGRSIWILDDLTPIRHWTAVMGKEAHLFPVLPVHRYRYHSGIYGVEERDAGKNPPEGALIHYYLSKKPKSPVTIEILDADGKLVKKLTSEPEPEEDDDPAGPEKKPEPKHLRTEPGIHRANWDLRYKGAEPIKKAKTDGGNAKDGPLVSPGTYTVKLTVDGQSQMTAVEVKLDPRQAILAALGGTGMRRGDEELLADLDAQLKFALQVRDDITRLSRRVHQLRAIRQQLVSRNDLLKDVAKAEPLVKASKALIEKVDALEGKFHNPKAVVSYDILAFPGGAKLYSQITQLYGWLLDSDGPPTQGAREVYADQAAELRKLEAELDALLAEDLAKLNEQAKELEVPGILDPGKGEAAPK